MAVDWKKLAFAEDVIPLSTVTTKGDIIVASGNGAVTRLGIGTDTYILNVATDTPGWKDPATLAVALHAATHKNGAADEILLNEFGEPTGAVAINGQQLNDQIFQTVANEAAVDAYATPVVGKPLFSTAELALYICTSAV